MKIVNKTLDFDDLEEPKCKAIFEGLVAMERKLHSYGVSLYIDDHVGGQRRRGWEYAWVLKHAPIETNWKVLDAGPGLSLFPHFLASRGADVHTVDLFIHQGLRGAASGVLDLNVTEHFGNLENLFIFQDGTFDAIFAISVLEHISNDEQALKELTRILKPGGFLSITFDFHAYAFPTRSGRLYTTEDGRRLRNAVQDSLELRFNQEIVDTTDWSNPPIDLGESADQKYTFAAMFFQKKEE